MPVATARAFSGHLIHTIMGRSSLAARPAAEWVERLGAAGVPIGRVRGVLEALAGQTFTVDHPTLGALPLVRSPLGASMRPPPLVGEHTREILDELDG